MAGREPCAFHFTAMGSPCALYLHAEAALAEQAASAAIAEAHRLEKAYSRYLPDSILSRINRAAAVAGTVTLDAESAGLVDYAYACFHKSDGLFDISAGVLSQAWDFSCPRLPTAATVAALLPRIGLDRVHWARPQLTFTTPGMAFDFGGIGKEYAVDRLADICQAYGINAGLIELGGDIRVIGPHPDGRPWTIHLSHPRQPDCAMAIIELAYGALASSGDYERYIEVDGQRYCHILNPRSGWPVRTMAAVCVVADRCMVAGSVATIAMLKEKEGAAWLASLGLAHRWMDEQGRQGGNL